MTPIRTTPVAVSIHRDGDSPIFGESRTTVRIDDEAAGAFLVIEQDGGAVKLDTEELDAVYRAARRLLKAQPEEVA